MKRSWPLLFLIAACVPALAADMYSWTDANGVRHFSDSPPPASAKAQKIRLKGGVATNEEAPADPATSAGTSLAAAAGYSPDDIKRNCEIARRNLATAEDQALPMDADGFPIDLDAAKTRQAQIDKANQQITLFCTN